MTSRSGVGVSRPRPIRSLFYCSGGDFDGHRFGASTACLTMTAQVQSFVRRLQRNLRIYSCSLSRCSEGLLKSPGYFDKFLTCRQSLSICVAQWESLGAIPRSSPFTVQTVRHSRRRNVIRRDPDESVRRSCRRHQGRSLVRVPHSVRRDRAACLPSGVESRVEGGVVRPGDASGRAVRRVLRTVYQSR